MEPEAVPESPRPRLRLQRLASELQRDWGVTLRIFNDYRELPPHRRYRALGQLFERLCPWIERGIHAVTWSHFVLIPTEQALARVFAHTTQKEALPKSYVLYLRWIESIVMRGLVKEDECFTPEKHTPGDPGARLCARFNSLALRERELLYLYLVEGCSPTEVSDNLGISYPQALEAIPKLWARIQGTEPRSMIPTTWQIPHVDADGMLVVTRAPTSTNAQH